MRVLFLTAHPGIAGPLPKLAPLMLDEMRRLDCEATTETWSHRQAGESPIRKVIERSRDLWRIRRRLRAQQFDVMLVTTTHDWAALLRDIPLLAFTRGCCEARVLHFHGSMVDRLLRPGRWLFKACSRRVVRGCDVVLVLSRQERRQWETFCPSGRFEVVVNPFVAPQSVTSRVGRTRDRVPALLFIGRLIPEKGVYDLLEAVRALSLEHDFLLRIAGQGTHEGAIRERVLGLGLDDRVELVGYVEGESLAKLYLSSDIFVLPTYFGEGFPTVISEAMSYGLPIVTTRIRGAADLLSEVENALFVPPRDPPALSRALLRLFNDPGLAADMGERNRGKVKAFAPSAVVPRYVDIMKSLVAGDGEDDVDTC